MKNLLVIVVLFCSFSFAQVATGTPAYGSFSGGPDIVNNANLNVHLSIPVLSKPGRGMNFTYSLGFDNSVWKKVPSGATFLWQPAQNWGWIAETQVKTGFIQYESSIAQCQSDTLRWYNYTVYYYDFYLDPGGVMHTIGQSVWNSPGQCQSITSQPTFSMQLNDGSGMTITGNVNLTPKVTYPDGTIFAPPVNATSGAGTATDSNGNQISITGGVYTDTLGSTALTVAGSGTPASAKTYTYTDSSNTARAVTVNYQPLLVRTNFGCGTDYGKNGTTTANLVTRIDLPNGTSYSFSYEDTPGYPGFVTGRLKQITLPTGGTIGYQYSGGDTSKGIYCDDGSTAYLTRIVDSQNTGYVREHADAFGHWKTTIIYPNNDQTVIDFQKVQNSALFVETQRVIYSGPPTTGTMKAKSASCYNTCSHGKGGAGLADAVALPITVIDTDSYTDNSRISGTWTSFDAYGARTQLNEYDFGAVNGSRGSLIRYALTSYTTLTNGPHVPTSVQVWLPGTPDTKVAQTTYAYDAGSLTPTTATQHVTAQGARGNLTSITQWSNGATDPVTSFTYFDTGMVKQITDPGSHVTNFDYTDNFSDGQPHNSLGLVYTVKNHLNQIVATNKYQWPSGALLETKDANNQTTSVTYDSLFRPITVTYPDGGSLTYNYTDGSNSTVEIDTLLSTGLTKIAMSKADGYGRTIRSGATNGTNYDLVDTCYDNMGRVLAVSAPFQNAFTAAQTNCASVTDGTVYAYDTLGRASSVTAKAPGLSDRVTNYTYTGNAAQVADAGNGNGTTKITKVSRYDGLGRLTGVCEASDDPQQGNSTTADCSNSGFDIAPTGFKTTYAYNVFDQLTGVTQGLLTARSFAYNALGRLTQVSTPESGDTTFSYYTEGLTYQRIRPAPNGTSGNVTTTYSYDGIHRLSDVSYSEPAGTSPTTPAVNFAYDLASDSIGGTTVNFTNATGRLGRATVGQTKNWFSYDAMGRVGSNWQTVPPQYSTNAAYQLQYTYDKAGDLVTFNNAYNTMTYAYDVGQRLLTATSSLSDAAHPATMFSTTSSSYGRFGIGNYTLGASINSGVQTVVSYTPFGELASKSATSNGGGGTTQFSMGSMSYAPNGMLTAATVNSSTWTHAYDDMGRLITSQNGGANPFNFNYDRYGNRWQQSQTGGTTVNTPTDNTSNKLANNNPQNITYDALGNIITETIGVTPHSYKYDAENRLIQVDAGSTATYVYDAFNRRVQKTTGAGTLNYTYDLGSNVAVVYSGTSAPLSVSRSEVFAGGHRATYALGHTYFHHRNWLGSRSITTDETGAAVQKCEWNPFGELISCADQRSGQTQFNTADAITPYGYADYERDSETGLDHMQFRYHNSRIGRLMSADLLSGSVSNPQGLNKFGYVLNNPVTFTDPLGLQFCKPIPEYGPAQGRPAPREGCARGFASIFSGGNITSLSLLGWAIDNPQTVDTVSYQNLKLNWEYTVSWVLDEGGELIDLGFGLNTTIEVTGRTFFSITAPSSSGLILAGMAGGPWIPQNVALRALAQRPLRVTPPPTPTPPPPVTGPGPAQEIFEESIQNTTKSNKWWYSLWKGSEAFFNSLGSDTPSFNVPLVCIGCNEIMQIRYGNYGTGPES
jgi:RHS repeat-associated protein